MKYLFILSIAVSTLACAQQPQAEVAQTTTKTAEHSTQATEEVSINWMTVNEAMEAQQKEPKKIMIDFYTSWCGPCKMLDRNTFHNADVAKYVNENFYAVKFNAEGNEVVNFKGKNFVNANYKETKGRGNPHQFSQAFQVRAYPTVVFLDEESNFIFPLKGYVDAKGIEPTLKVIASDSYKNIKTKEEWNSWMKDGFTSTFN